MSAAEQRICKTKIIIGSHEVQPGDFLTIEEMDFDKDEALVHLGGMIRCKARLKSLIASTRSAEPDEINKTLKSCPRCNRIELEKNGSFVWLAAPPCFQPRPGITLVSEPCPDCDKA